MTRMQTGTRRIRTALVAGAALLTLTGTVTACGSSDSDDETIEGAQTGDAQKADNAEESDESELKDLYRRYWDALITLENSEELEEDVLDGIATDALIQDEIERVSSFKSNGIHRVGEPDIWDITVTVDGDEARIEACKNDEGWDYVEDGEVVSGAIPESLLEPHAIGATAKKSSGDWLINADLASKDATITCS